ncbi:hypothetical protein JOE57_000753 [Microlunatus panaciterrae]|uniref:DUF4352 domain-containing protein n=1 Tax=Microlunatus panaciterrae TaxID=400768 RepID=A0ABS2RH09_9ACTN|nr:DUF4352 domain-containing protein [Microlunatus panaciterrae]MBM7797832.1 hypothetical protein [Microlunatus panaciterrae]
MVSLAVVLVVALVVVIATLVANSNDRNVSAPTPAPTVSRVRPTAAPSGNSIDFTSTEGSGRLQILEHEWVTGGAEPPISGSYLRIEIELSSTDGEISYDSAFFQAFDARGQLFDSTHLGAKDPLLDIGVLRPGQRVRGFISFDMPRGDVTLLMSNESYESVTAIKIQD